LSPAPFFTRSNSKEAQRKNCPLGEIGIRTTLKMSLLRDCRFESRFPSQTFYKYQHTQGDRYEPCTKCNIPHSRSCQGILRAPELRRDGRAAEGTGLLNLHTFIAYRGFESLSLRHYFWLINSQPVL
jgi:hypothetical protein